MFGAYFTFGSVLNVVGVIIPILIRQHNLSLFAGGLLAFAFFISFGVFSIPAGLLADRIGAKPVVVGGVILMGIGCGAIPWVGSYVAITVCAFTIGSGVAFLQTAGNPLIGRLDRRENYHRNLTLTIGFCGIGAFIGPFCLSALLAHGEPWQRLYAGYAAVCGILAILFLISSFPAQETSASEKIRVKDVLRLLGHPISITYFFAVFFYVGAEVGTASWIVKFFQQVHPMADAAAMQGGQSLLLRSLPTLPALTVSLFWGLQGVGRLTSAPGIRKLGPRWMLRLYSLGAIVSLLFAVLAPWSGASAAGFIGCGFFTSVLITLLFSGAIQTFKQSQGAISGLLVTASIGGAIIPPLVGLAADHFGLRLAMMLPVIAFTYVFGVSIFGNASYE
jgi:fucose permease